MLAQPNDANSGTCAERPIPLQARNAMAECLELLNKYLDREVKRRDFLQSCALRIKEVVIPAMEEFAAQFPAQRVTVRAYYPVKPTAMFRYDTFANAGIRVLSIEIWYEPGEEVDLMQLTLKVHGDDPVPISLEPLEKLTRESVFVSLAQIVSNRLKQDLEARPWQKHL